MNPGVIVAQDEQAQETSTQGQGLDTRIQGPVEFTDLDIKTVAQILTGQSGVPIIVGGSVNATVSLSLNNPTIREILDSVLPANNLAYAVDDNGVIQINTPEIIERDFGVQVDLIRRVFSPQYRDIVEFEDALTGLKSPQGSIFLDSDTGRVIVEDTPDAIEAMEELILTFDIETSTEVFQIRYGNAAEIAEQLVGVVNTIDGQLLVNQRNNVIIITDTVERLARARAIIEQLDVRLEFRVIPLAFAYPEDVLPLAEIFLSENGYIDFDPRTSRVIIQDIPSIVDQIVELIQELDISPQQVYVEVDIVQINNDRSFSFGTTASFGEDIGEGGDPSAPNVASATGGGGFFSFNPFLTTSGSGISLLDVNQGSYRIQLDALVTKDLAEVIASPRLMIEDGGFGSFTLGSQEPFATRQQNNFFNSSSGDYFTQQFRDVGTSINLEVYASEAGYVNMFINIEDTRARRVELSNLGEGLAVDGSFIDTSITVKDSRTVVLGGIINRNTSSTRSGVPILSSIPIIGNLFSNRSKDSAKQKLLIFITPKLVNIDDPYDFAQVDNYKRIKDLQSSGATGFIDADVDDKFLEWDNESVNEDAALQEALDAYEPVRASDRSRPPSFSEQQESGLMRLESESDD